VWRYLRDGEDPDPRFTLANERTFLAWVRTSLALVAAGIGLEAFVPGLDPLLRRVVAGALVVLGAGLAASSLRRWLLVEHALRHRRSLPLPTVVPLLALGVAVTALVLVILVLSGG
jgi:putative membrane protein